MFKSISIMCQATALAIAMVMAGCGGPGAKEESTTKKITYPRAEADATLQLNALDYFEIALPADRSDGLRWLFAEPPDDKLFKIVEDRFDATATEADGGAGEDVGTKIWLFQALTAGETGITIEQLRPWEEDKPPAVSKTFQIAISGADAGAGGD